MLGALQVRLAGTPEHAARDFDPTMTKDLVTALREDGIDPSALGDRSLVERASRWAFARSQTVRMGFCLFLVTAKNGRLAVEPGLEEYMAKACATAGPTWRNLRWLRAIMGPAGGGR